MNTNQTRRAQKFYCYNCKKETLGILSNVQTSHGRDQCIICTNCFNVISLSLLDKINKLIKRTTKMEISQTTNFASDSKKYYYNSKKYYYNYPKIDKSIYEFSAGKTEIKRDPTTQFTVGSKEYYEYYHPIIDKKGKCK